MIRLWVHESSRVFADRLINDIDQSWFKRLIMELVTVIFGSKMEEEAIFGDNSLRFGDILKLDFGKEYEEIKDNIKLVRVLEEK